jgi:hypothetical protein
MTDDMFDDDPTVRAWKEAQSALAEAEADFTEEGRARRIYITDRMADAAYRLEKLLKERGRLEESYEARRQADKYWGQVVAMVGDQPAPAPKKNPNELSVREAADRLDAMRLTKFST